MSIASIANARRFDWLKEIAVVFTAIFLLVSATTAFAAKKVTYYYTDQQGNLLATTDEQGNIVSVTDRRPYGEQALGVAESGPGYGGHVTDSDTNLIYMQARYYDPSKGGFLSSDPVNVGPGNLFSFGRYNYASNNPLTNTDPDGRQTLPPSTYQIDWTKPETRQALVDFAVPLIPVLGDAQSVSEAIQDPSPVNVAIAIVGVVPEGGAARILKGAAGGERAGKAFTRAGKAEVKAENAAAHEGKLVCENCGRETVPAQQSKPGVTPPGNEAHVDHVVPRSKGGNGSPDNGQILCRDCNLEKGDDYE